MEGLAGMGDIGKLMQNPEIVAKAREMARNMGLTGGGAGGMGGGAEAAELERLRRENAMLRAKAEL